MLTQLVLAHARVQGERRGPRHACTRSGEDVPSVGGAVPRVRGTDATKPRRLERRLADPQSIVPERVL